MAKRQAVNKHYLDHIGYHTPVDMGDEESWNYIFGYCDSGNPDDIEIGGGESDMDAIDNSRDFADYHSYVSASYNWVDRQELIQLIKRDGWWFVDGEETDDDGFPVDEQYRASTKKSQKATKMAKKQAIKKTGETGWTERMPVINDLVEHADELYRKYWDNAPEKYWSEQESNLFNDIENGLDELEEMLNQYIDLLMDGSYSASTKKSKYERLHKALNKLGGFTKEDDEEDGVEGHTVSETVDASEHPGSQRNRLSSIFDDDEDSEGGEAEDESEEESEESEKGCKSKKSLRTSKKKMKMRKAEDMPEDADDQQDINQKGSGNAGSELPEDADDVKEVNEKGSGNAGSELPEDADDTQDQKQARARKQLMRSRNKGMKKFSVTAGGSPNQESYIKRYNQAPTVRRAIDDHFGSSASKSFDEVQMLQERIDAMNKSRRNTESNNVPMKLRKR